MQLQITNKRLTLIFGFFMLIGLVGFFTPYEAAFRHLSAYNLLLNFILISFSFHKEIRNHLKTVLFCFSIGLIAELIGVHTNILFGNYKYTDHLGIRIADVPLIIGINWSVLSIGAWHLGAYLSKKKMVRIISGALILVLFDIVMEPVAINLQFWQWQNNEIPLYNYISWFIVALPCLWICSVFQPEEAGISKTVLVAQAVFFILLNFRLL